MYSLLKQSTPDGIGEFLLPILFPGRGRAGCDNFNVHPKASALTEQQQLDYWREIIALNERNWSHDELTEEATDYAGTGDLYLINLSPGIEIVYGYSADGDTLMLVDIRDLENGKQFIIANNDVKKSYGWEVIYDNA